MVKTDHGDVRLAVIHRSQYEEAHIASRRRETIAKYQIHRDQCPMSILMRDVVASGDERAMHPGGSDTIGL